MRSAEMRPNVSVIKSREGHVRHLRKGEFWRSTNKYRSGKTQHEGTSNPYQASMMRHAKMEKNKDADMTSKMENVWKEQEGGI